MFPQGLVTGSISIDVADAERFADDSDANAAVVESLAGVLQLEPNLTNVELVLQSTRHAASMNHPELVTADYTIALPRGPASQVNETFNQWASILDAISFGTLAEDIQQHVNQKKQERVVQVLETFVAFAAPMNDVRSFREARLRDAVAAGVGIGQSWVKAISVRYTVAVDFRLPGPTAMDSLQRAIATSNGVLVSSVNVTIPPDKQTPRRSGDPAGPVVEAVITQSSASTIDVLKASLVDETVLAMTVSRAGLTGEAVVTGAPASGLSVLVALLTTSNISIAVPDLATLDEISAAAGAGPASLERAWVGQGIDWRAGPEYGVLTVVSKTAPRLVWPSTTTSATPSPVALGGNTLLNDSDGGVASMFVVLLAVACSLACLAGCAIMLFFALRRKKAGGPANVQHTVQAHQRQQLAAAPDMEHGGDEVPYEHESGGVGPVPATVSQDLGLPETSCVVKAVL